MFELTTTAAAAASAATLAEYTPVRELAGRFSDVPKVDLTDYHQYSILVEDFKGVIIFTAMFTHAFVAATATSKLNLDLRDDDFLIGFQDALQFPIVKKAAAGIRLKRTDEGVQATVPLGQLTRIQRTPELLSRRLGGDVPALKAFMQGLRLIHPALSEPGPIDFEIPAARVFKNHKGFKPDWDKLELVDEDSQDPAEMLLEATRSVRFMGRATKDGVPFNQLMKLPDGEFVGYARQHVFRLAEVYVAGVYDFPTEVVEYVTQTELSKVRLQYFSAFLQSLINITLKDDKGDETDEGEGGATNYTETLNPISTIARATKDSRLVPVKRTNDDGLLVTQRGHFRFIPEVGIDNAVRVENEIELGSTTEGGEFAAVDVITPEKTHYREGLNAAGQATMLRKRAGRNEPVFTDWYQGKFTYTTDSGTLKVDDLNSCRPATATHIRQLLESDPQRGAAGTAFSHLGKALAAIGYKLTQHAGLKYTEWFLPDSRTGVIAALNEGSTKTLLNIINADLARMGRTLSEDSNPALYKYFSEEWAARYGFVLADITDKSPVLPLRLLAEAADYLAKNYEKRLSDICEACGVHGATLAIAICVVISKYAPKKAEIRAQDEKLRAVYVNPQLETAETFTMPKVPFVKNATLLAHQGKIFSWLKNLPPAAVIDVQAGGGKTIVALIDIALNMKVGRVKRPLIMCPADLMKNYFIDANKVFGGRVNIIAISTVTVNSWGYDKLRELIQSAPPNTICITGFEFLSGRSEDYGYGTSRVTTSNNLEFLREFEWDGLWVDEVHKLKNVYSVRTRMAMQLASTIKVIRQMSGTYLPDTNEDVVALFAQIEPTVFGDLKRFNEEFKDPNKGRGAWIPNAGRAIRRRQEQHSNVITIKRREWKALLPKVTDEYFVVPMDQDVQIIYNRLVEEQIEAIREEIAEKNPKLKKALETGKMTEDEEDELENFLDGSIHIARLEEFLCDPMADEAGFAITDERKAISPKIKKVHELITKHQAQIKQYPGKVLIFAKNHIGANAVYKYAPPELKKHILLYRASGGEMTKDQYLDEFEKNPEIWALVGVEDSLNTGRNLQFCSRLIRIQAVWNWGAMEQGEARVLRPNVASEFRKEIFIDMVIVNNSIDVTKTSRMVAKLVETLKWYESEDPRFQNLPSLPPVSMSLTNISASNSFTDGGENSLANYIDTYQQYRNLEEEAYEDFLKDKTRFSKPYKLEDGGVLPGSAMLKKVPYIPGIDLYGMEELGLVKFTTYESENRRKKEFDPTGLIIHTEDGEGECTGMSDRSVRVRINGKVQAYNKDTAFVVQRKTVNVRETMARIAGADSTRAVDPGRSKKELPKVIPNKPVPNVDKTVNQQFSVFAINYNEWIALGVDAEDPDVPVTELRRLGFVPNRPYYYTELKTWRHLAKWLDLAQAKLEINEAHLKRLQETLELWKRAKDLDNFMKVLTPTVLKDFLRAAIKPVGAKEARPYVMVDNGDVYLCIDQTAHKQSWSAIRRIIVPGIAWEEAEHEMFLFCANRQDAKRKLVELTKSYTITNALKTSKRIDELRTIGK